jgi:hypothetical protein
MKRYAWPVASWLCLTALLSLPTLASAGTAIKINSANVDVTAEQLTIEGLNFPDDGSLIVTLGDTLLEDCVIAPSTLTCSISSTPALGGGTWSVQLSAGNSPNANASIDVYILTGSANCSPGDFVTCYSGERSEIGVGECRSGTRVCSSDGNFGACEGQVTPVSEYPDSCFDGFDNDCDGEIDECRDILADNPTYFYVNGTFEIPPGLTSIHVAVWGAGGGGSGTRTDPESGGYSGGGGGAGGFSLIQDYTVSEGDSFAVTVGQGGSGGLGDAFTGSPGQASRVVAVDGSVVLQAGGGGGADYQNAGAGGVGTTTIGASGTPGQFCDAGPKSPGTSGGAFVEGGDGGTAESYQADNAGWGGFGADAFCYWECDTFGSDCVAYVTPADGEPGENGLVKVWWDTP